MGLREQLASKAAVDDFGGRFREIISDPLNLAIQRHPLAGVSDNGVVVLHNGIRVPIVGPHAYYGAFAGILVINRGVHEPLEEYVFQQLLKQLPPAAVMLELGAYWGHYSMWLKSTQPQATVHLVEPEAANINAGINNFRQNGLHGQFIQAFVGHGHFSVDHYLATKGIEKLDILHADIQGYELEMLTDSAEAFGDQRISYVLVSTHSQSLHQAAVNQLQAYGYRLEVSSDFDSETTSFDGFIFASSPSLPAIFPGFRPMGRRDILQASPATLAAYIAAVIQPTAAETAS